jgi:hypothetical protein
MPTQPYQPQQPQQQLYPSAGSLQNKENSRTAAAPLFQQPAIKAFDAASNELTHKMNNLFNNLTTAAGAAAAAGHHMASLPQ